MWLRGCHAQNKVVAWISELKLWLQRFGLTDTTFSAYYFSVFYSQSTEATSQIFVALYFKTAFYLVKIQWNILSTWAL